MMINSSLRLFSFGGDFMLWVDENTIRLNGEDYQVQYFRKHEKNDLGEVCWGEPDNMNPRLIYLLDQFRNYVGRPIRINYGTQGSHSPNSQHFLGNAIDLYVPALSWKEQFLAATRFPFTGVGVYPFWNNPGLHLDIRTLQNGQKDMWWRNNHGNYEKIETLTKVL